MCNFPTCVGFRDDEHPAAQTVSSGTQMECHHGNRRSREIDPQVLRFNFLKGSLGDTAACGGRAGQIELPMPGRFKCCRILGPFSGRLDEGWKEHNGVRHPALAKRRPIEIIKGGEEVAHQFPHLGLGSWLSVKTSSKQQADRESHTVSYTTAGFGTLVFVGDLRFGKSAMGGRHARLAGLAG